MPYTQADLEALDAAYASGAQAVRTADGRQVTYRSFADYSALRRLMLGDITRTADPSASSLVKVGTARGIS